MVTYLYKIQNKNGLYSSGGTRVKWQDIGNYWTTMRNLRMHLKLIQSKTPQDSPDYPYRECSIVRFKAEEDEILEVIK